MREDEPMPGYVIAMLDVFDPAAYERYKAAAPPTIAAAGGRYLARGGESTLEGGHDGRRIASSSSRASRRRAPGTRGAPTPRPRRLRESCARGTSTFLLLPGVT
jgi:hypothetical protein